MGEWSKSIGERGEEIVALFLQLLGWGTEQKGIDIKCVRTRHIGESGNPRTVHGIDFLFSYSSPLCDDLCDNLIISAKYKSVDYPSTATKFKEYYNDLTQAVECFSKSEEYQRQVKLFPGSEKIRNFGVLLWFNSVDAYADHKTTVANIDVLKSDDRYSGVYFVDNKTASFLYEAITFVKSANAESTTSFVYIETGKYTNPASQKFSGDSLPLEYLNLGLLPMKATDKAGFHTLYLCSAAPFKEENLGRLIGLSQSISQDWANKVRILFPSYDPLHHEKLAGRVINAFADKKITEKLEIGTYKPSLLNP